MNPVYFLFILAFATFQNPNLKKPMSHSGPAPSEYLVKSVEKPIPIDANWEKEVWQEVPAAEIALHMGENPAFSPTTQVKLRYDKQHIYGIFKVEDRYVRCVVEEINGPVSTDSCVEFFFAPDSRSPLEYFNLEINCSGVPLFHYVTAPRKTYEVVDAKKIEKIDIAHSLSGKIDPEIQEPLTWYIEFKLPLKLLKQYRNISTPAPGVRWKANFYKTGSKTSNPHYFTWNEVVNHRPDFHLPQYFGTLIFD